MTTVMQWGNSDGIKGRCDAKCHNAATPECDCMCGGRYHGTGRSGTFDDVRRRHGVEILEAAKERARVEGWNLAEFPEAMNLFEPREDH